jgi:hypothetical protein
MTIEEAVLLLKATLPNALNKAYALQGKRI